MNLRVEDIYYLAKLTNILENKELNEGEKLSKCCDYLFNWRVDLLNIDRFMHKDCIWPTNINDKMRECIMSIMASYAHQIIAIGEIMGLDE